MSGEKEDLETTKVVTKLLRTLAKIEALEKQDAALLPPRFVGANQDFAFESDLHYGTYSGLRYGSVLDPYGLMAMLGFLVFLFYLIYNFLNANGNAGSGRESAVISNDDLISLSTSFWSKMEEFHKGQDLLVHGTVY